MGNKYSKSLEKVSKSVTKKGKLKGNNKQETKALKGMCPHHKITKKGKLKPTVFNNGDGTCICKLCGERFPARFYNNDELHRIVGDMGTINNQAKYMATAIGAGPKSIDYFCEMGVRLKDYPKSYKKIRAVADKQGRAKAKKRRNNMGGSSQYGSWGVR